MQNNKNTIIWKTAHAKYSIASVRYRCLLPAMSLISFGFKSVVLQKNETINNYNSAHSLIFVKTFTKHDLELAKKAHQHGVSIYIDLCDNIFVENYKNNSTFCCFTEIAQLSKAVVTTGEELTALIAQHLITPTNIIIIPDQVEALNNNLQLQKLIQQKEFAQPLDSNDSESYFKMTITAINNQLKNNFVCYKFVKINHAMLSRLKFAFKLINKNKNIKLSYFLIKTKLTKKFINSTAKKVVWFGNAGGGFSTFGLPSLAAISNHLIEVNKNIPIKLLVISNDYPQYCKLIKPLPFLTDYKQWHPHQIFDDIASADICIVPNSKDDFSICKSPNRTLLALLLKVPVVATRIPSLTKLEGCIICDDWVNGLLTYLSNKSKVINDINISKVVIADFFSAKTVARQWYTLISNGNKSENKE